MLDSFTNDPPIFRHLIFPSFEWKDLIASNPNFSVNIRTALCLADLSDH